MDKKAIIQALLWAFIAFMIFSLLSKRLLPPVQPQPDASPTTTQPGAGPGTTTAPGPTAPGSTVSDTTSAPVVAPSGAYRAAGASEPMQITISEDTYQLLKDDFVCSERGEFEVKGFGMLNLYFLERELKHGR